MLLFLIMLLNLSPAKKAIMLSPLHTPVKVITFPLILDCDNVIFALDSYMESILWIAKKAPKMLLAGFKALQQTRLGPINSSPTESRTEKFKKYKEHYLLWLLTNTLM